MEDILYIWISSSLLLLATVPAIEALCDGQSLKRKIALRYLPLVAIAASGMGELLVMAASLLVATLGIETGVHAWRRRRGGIKEQTPVFSQWTLAESLLALTTIGAAFGFMRDERCWDARAETYIYLAVAAVAGGIALHSYRKSLAAHVSLPRRSITLLCAVVFGGLLVSISIEMTQSPDFGTPIIVVVLCSLVVIWSCVTWLRGRVVRLAIWGCIGLAALGPALWLLTTAAGVRWRERSLVEVEEAWLNEPPSDTSVEPGPPTSEEIIEFLEQSAPHYSSDNPFMASYKYEIAFRILHTVNEGLFEISLDDLEAFIESLRALEAKIDIERPLADVDAWAFHESRIDTLVTYLKYRSRFRADAREMVIGPGKRLLAMLRVVQVNAACRLYLSNEEEPLTQLDQLVPKYLPAIPADPFSSGPLKLLPLADAAYSVGDDGIDQLGATARRRSDGRFLAGEIFEYRGDIGSEWSWKWEDE